MRNLIALVLLAGVLCAAPPAKFREHVIASDLTGGYQVTTVDMDLDGDSDLLALASGMKELVWFESPDWKRHVLTDQGRRMINVAACSTDTEGYPVFVLAQEFSSVAAKSPGTVLVLERDGDVKRPWKVREIDKLPTSHRMRCADFDGKGAVFVNAPLTGAESLGPDFRDPAPLVYYRAGEWRRELIGDKDRGVMHGIHVVDWDGDGRDEVLTASFGGVYLYRWEDGQWWYSEIVKGDPAPWPKSGASEITVGQLDGERFLATIEPWHGDKVVVYTREGDGWRRNVIDDSFVDGHTVVPADLNGDGRDELVAGHRKGVKGVYVYEADETGRKWSRYPLDVGGVAAASCVVEDLTGDGLLDVACIGSSTANLKLFEQVR